VYRICTVASWWYAWRIKSAHEMRRCDCNVSVVRLVVMTLRQDDPKLTDADADQETEVWQLGSNTEPEARDLLSVRLIDSQRSSRWWVDCMGRQGTWSSHKCREMVGRLHLVNARQSELGLVVLACG
jgi:hypothetical protein